MHSFSPALVALVAASLALAKPVPQAGAKKGFTISQSVPKPFLPGPNAVLATYQKFGKAAPDYVVAAAAGGGSVTATPQQYDSEYLCPVTIGGQTLNLDFDTGSADLWVFSTELPSTESAGHDLYQPDPANQLQGFTWNITYGDGSSSSGDVYQDTVNIGGTTVTGQAIEAAEQVSTQFQQDNGDGLVGLAFSSINTVQPQPQTTFFDTAISQGVLNQNVFTADLKAGQPGSYDFGFIDSSKYSGKVTYAAVDNSQGFWMFNAAGYAVEGGKSSQTTFAGIADTGTSLFYLPDDAVSAYYSKVRGAVNDNTQGGYVFPCSATLPSFTIVIGSYKAVVPGSYINYAPGTGSTCFGGIQSNAAIGFSIFGDVFLKSQFVVFDSANTQVGFAAKV